MKRILESDIKCFSHYNYIVFKSGKYLLTNNIHHYGNLEFKFDDSDLKKIKYQSIDEILLRLSNKSLLKKEDIYDKFKSRIQDQFEYNSSKYISRKIGNSLVSKIASTFYYNGNFEYYHQSVDTSNDISSYKTIKNGSGEYLIVDIEKKIIRVLINYNDFKNTLDAGIKNYLDNKNRYLQNGWKWSEEKIEKDRKIYTDLISDYKNLLILSKDYDIKINFILNDIKEETFNCIFEEISDIDLAKLKNDQIFSDKTDWDRYHESQTRFRSWVRLGSNNNMDTGLRDVRCCISRNRRKEIPMKNENMSKRMSKRMRVISKNHDLIKKFT